MPGENLTRTEAAERAGLVSTQSYEIELDLTGRPESGGAAIGEPQTFRSRTVARFAATPGASTFIDAITATVHSITLNGAPVDLAAADGVRIALNDLQEQNVLEVDADMRYSNSGEGLHRFVDPVDGEVYLYSQFEVPDARRVFAVFEQPDAKATFAFTVTAPAAWQVLSNQPTPEPALAGDGTATWRFTPTPRISSYITAIVAGPYVAWRDELVSSDGRTIPLGFFSRASLAEFVDHESLFDVTKKGFAYFEEKFQRAYPFEKYDQIFVPEFNAGAMENAGCVTFTETYVFRSKVTDAVRERRVVTILHELAHMWFGDLVTMKWWNDLWLNESFAEWASTIATAEATEWTEAWTTFQAMEKTWAYRQDQLPSTHPISARIDDFEDVQVNFDGITYAKGGSVLKQLAAWVGVEAFFAGVAAYFRKHEWGNTELSDLLTELSTTSGRDLSDWSAQWLETSGVNTLRPELTVDADGVITGFAVLQEAPQEHPHLRAHRLAIGFYDLRGDDDDRRLVRTHRIELDVAGARTDVPELVGRERPALILINDDDLAYAKIRLDAASLQVAIAHLSRIDDPLARALVWGAAWDATRDAETSASAYISLVLGNISAETESTTVRTTLGQLLLVARSYVAPERRTETVTLVGTALWELAKAAEAGSDHQFQFVKFFAAIASTHDHMAALRGLLDGGIALDGLEIDTDLRWELLQGLVVGAAAGEAEIAAELDRDATAKGQQAAARLRAAIPTEAAKRAAFDALAVASDADVPSNEIQRSITMGFQHVADPSVLAAIVGPYFSSLERIWTSRSYQTAESFVIGLYPAPLASSLLADSTRAWLDANPEIPALRRLIAENLSGVERALRAQARDQSA